MHNIFVQFQNAMRNYAFFSGKSVKINMHCDLSMALADTNQILLTFVQIVYYFCILFKSFKNYFPLFEIAKFILNI